ncbi:MAG: NYN domain-containing protein [Mariprofundaceae bacterium]|nr:NYN domain-containing protein [Mariprofundaceae bacterium]
MPTSKAVAVFIDVENIHYSSLNNFSETPNWSKIVESCKRYGRIVSIQAFGDWLNFSKELPEIQRNAIQPVFVPLSQDGKSSLDCYLTVSAMKLFFQNHALDTIILASGDRDYIPLLAELKALGKRIIILAVQDTLSQDLTRIADDVIPYESSSSEAREEMKYSREEDIRFVVETLKSLEQTSFEGRWVNLATLGLEMKRRNPQFSHKHHGYGKLVEMLDDIKDVELSYDNHEKTIAMARIAADSDIAVESPRQYGEIINLHDTFGFIRPDADDENIFFHISKVDDASLNELQPGTRVSYTCYRTHRGNNAENVVLETTSTPEVEKIEEVDIVAEVEVVAEVET